MKILFVHSGSDLYGASRSLLRLTARLVAEGHSIHVILPEKGPLVQELEQQCINVYIHTGLPIATREVFKRIKSILYLFFRIPGSIVKIMRMAHSLRLDLIHTNTALILSPGIAAFLCRIPHIWHVRESFVEFGIFWNFYQWYMLLFSKIIVCVSTPMAQQFRLFGRRDDIVVLHNGFPIDEFSPIGKKRIDAFRSHFQLNGFQLVGVVGRIKFGRKGQDVFIQAVALLRGKYSNVRFLLIGSPFPGNEEHLSMLLELIKQLDLQESIIYTGDVPDIKAAYASLDISVLPSALPEPFGGVVIESMAFAKPVIGTNIGGTREQVEDGVTGFLIEPNDPSDLAEKIDLLLSNAELRTSMGVNGRKRFLDLFEYELFYKKMMQIYTNLNKGSR